MNRYDLFNGKMSEGVNGKYTLTHDSVKVICNLEAQLKSKDELLMEMCECVIANTVYFIDGIEMCENCGGISNHYDNCIVNKAQDYISKKEG